MKLLKFPLKPASESFILIVIDSSGKGIYPSKPKTGKAIALHTMLNICARFEQDLLCERYAQDSTSFVRFWIVVRFYFYQGSSFARV